MYMITSDTNLDLTCGAMFLTYNDLTGCYGWTSSPGHAYVFPQLRDAEDTRRCANAGDLCRAHTSRGCGDCTMLDATPRAEVIPAMVQNDDGEWSDGSWDTEDAQGNAL